MSVAETLPREEAPVSALRGSILRQVSRSFYLSIYLLPTKLRDPVSLGYLLARGIQGEALGDGIVELSASVSPLQQNPSERALIQSLQSCLDWLDRSEV